MAIAPIASAMSALKSLKDLFQTAIDLRDAEAFQAKRLEIQGRLLDAQQACFAANEERASLIDQVSDLKKQIVEMKDWETEKQRYELKAIDTAGFAYTPKPGMEAAEPPHWLCAACYQAGKKSLLQGGKRVAIAGPDQNKRWWDCSTCGSHVQTYFNVAPGRLPG